MQINLKDAAAYFKAQGNPMLAAAIERGEAFAVQFCGMLMQQQNGGGQMVMARELPASGGETCACGGGSANACKCKNGGHGGQMIPVGGGSPFRPTPGAAPLQVLPACYEKCDVLEPCLYEFMEQARKDYDEWSWLEYAKQEIDFVHLDVSVGGAGYQTGLPLAASQKVLFRQTNKQQLPYQPGALKIDPKWTGNPVPDAVIVRLWSGERNLSAIVDPKAAGLVQIGSDLRLQDFECKDDCWLVPWPKLFGCQTSAIPNRRAIYIEFVAGALGAATVTSLNPTILKKGSRLYGRFCGHWN